MGGCWISAPELQIKLIRFQAATANFSSGWTKIQTIPFTFPICFLFSNPLRITLKCPTYKTFQNEMGRGKIALLKPFSRSLPLYNFFPVCNVLDKAELTGAADNWKSSQNFPRTRQMKFYKTAACAAHKASRKFLISQTFQHLNCVVFWRKRSFITWMGMKEKKTESENIWLFKCTPFCPLFFPCIALFNRATQVVQASFIWRIERQGKREEKAF